MAVPKKKKSKSRTASRKASNTKVQTVNLTICPKCKEAVIPHRACKACGTYKKREI